MNRRQQVAVVVGALVIAGLALFPPWYATRNTWLSVRVPDHPLPRQVITVGEYIKLGHVFLGDHAAAHRRLATHMQKFSTKWTETWGKEDTDATVDVPLRFTQPHIDLVRMALLQLATLALTVAAVLVLKERKL